MMISMWHQKHDLVYNSVIPMGHGAQIYQMECTVDDDGIGPDVLGRGRTQLLRTLQHVTSACFLYKLNPILGCAVK